MINGAIILAGGLGTRLKGLVSDVPKPMAPVNNIPFLSYLLEYLQKYNISKVILSVGYKHEVIKNYFGTSYKNTKIIYAIEDEPLGTGGGIANALKYYNGSEVFLLNGDTFFDVNLTKLYNFHCVKKSQLTLSVKYLENFSRYGTVVTNKEKIVEFKEKQPLKSGYINGGVYVITKSIFEEYKNITKFSFEKDIMELGLNNGKQMYGMVSEGYFIDIGIPKDYKKAQRDFLNFLID